jgi:hypothetical protein
MISDVLERTCRGTYRRCRAKLAETRNNNAVVDLHDGIVDDGDDALRRRFLCAPQQ